MNYELCLWSYICRKFWLGMSPARGKPVPAGCCASWVGRGVCPRRASLATSTGKQQHQIHNVGTCLPNCNQFFLIQFISSWNQIFLGSYGLLTWGKMKYLFHIWSSSFQWAEDKSRVLLVRGTLRRQTDGDVEEGNRLLSATPICVRFKLFPIQPQMEF